MKIAIISDIHANQEALAAVLAAIDGVERILCCGDLVGYYDRPNEVCDMLRSRNVLCVRGNHDAYVTGALVPDAELEPIYRIDWTTSVLTAENRQWLANLPVEAEFAVNGVNIRLRHASPWDEETYVYPDKPELIARIDLEKGEILALGHTHHPLLAPAGKGLVVNPGSVGQPRDYNPAAAYAIVDCTNGDVSFHREKYPVAELQERLLRQSWPQAAIDILSRER